MQEEIIQNVQTILSTPQYSVPLDRSFGIDGILVDEPLPLAAAKVRSKIVAAVEYYEPRVKVTKVSFTGDDNGKFVPKVVIKIVSESTGY